MKLIIAGSRNICNYQILESTKDEAGWDEVLEANPPKKCKIELLFVPKLLGIDLGGFGG